MSTRSHANARQLPASDLAAGDRVKYDGRMADVVKVTTYDDGGADVDLRLWPTEVRYAECPNLMVMCGATTIFHTFKAL